MKRSLNFAILKAFTNHERLTASELVQLLADDYSKQRNFSYRSIAELLMTAKQNGLIDEVDFREHQGAGIEFIYSASEAQREQINFYIR